MFAAPLKTQVISFAPTGKSLVTLAMCETSISDCGRCSPEVCKQRTKIVDGGLGIWKCEHRMPSDQVSSFRFGTPAVPDQRGKTTPVYNDDGSLTAHAIDDAAQGVIDALLAEGAVYRREDELDIDDVDGVGEAIERVEASLAVARETAMLAADEAGVCLTDADCLTPIAVESENHTLIVISRSLAEALATEDGAIVVPVERNQVIKARPR